MRILLVEDDDLLSQILTEHLTSQRYVVDTATDGLMGLEYAQAAAYDAIVLDVNLPRLDGIHLCQRLRQQRYTVPILLLTAKGASSDKIMGLDAGADDYVVKPCPVEEISARIRALLRRPNSAGMPVLTWGKLSLDPVTCEVTCDRQPIALSPKEYGLLELFLRNPQRTFSGSVILEHLWSFEDAPGEETVRSHIKRLRRKLKSVDMEDILETVYGMGYRLKPPPHESSPATPDLPAPDPEPVADAARQAAIALWQEFQQPMLERVTVLMQAVAALAAQRFTDDVRQSAAHAAHKLAGSLGMFGFPQGSELGRILEEEFQTLPQPTDLPRLQALVAELQQVLSRPPLADCPAPSALPPSPHPTPPHWLLVDPDHQTAQALHAIATQTGIHLEIAPDLVAARSHLDQRSPQQMPDVILLDEALVKAEELLPWQDLQTPLRHPVMVILTHQDDFATRLACVRRGGNHILPKSTPPDDLIRTVQHWLPLPLPPIKVLAVDDDEVILNRLQRELSAWGIDLTTVSTSDTVWQTLETTHPDLVILDVEMPAVDGLELCRVIRSDRTWNQLPVLFLTARREPELVSQIYQAGADDYVSKPFTDVEIVTRIFNRLARNRLLQQAHASPDTSSA